MSLWALQWNSRGSTHLLHEKCLPLLFRTRKAARAFADERYGYIKTRADLRAPPHEWRMPTPVVVTIAARAKVGK